MENSEIVGIKEVVEQLLRQMTVVVFSIDVSSPATENKPPEGAKDFIVINLAIEEPRVLIGQNGQTLLELQRLLRIMINKKLQKDFYINLDINDYKKKKIEYLKQLATEAADQVSATGEQKVLTPMPAYERRIIHAQLATRADITTASQGEGMDRCVVIKLK